MIGIDEDDDVEDDEWIYFDGIMNIIARIYGRQTLQADTFISGSMCKLLSQSKIPT